MNFYKVCTTFPTITNY